MPYQFVCSTVCSIELLEGAASYSDGLGAVLMGGGLVIRYWGTNLIG